jgi:GNAT superfamily N-acetyltransferase
MKAKGQFIITYIRKDIMPDMLVKLLELPPLESEIDHLKANGIVIRRALAPEKHHVTAWIRQHFSEFWVSECEVAYSRSPISCFIATEGDQLIGFGCYDVTAKAFFGPTGVSEQARGRGVGKVLLLACLHALKNEGYVYGIIGGVGPAEFYNKVVGATLIESDNNGIYEGLLRSS